MMRRRQFMKVVTGAGLVALAPADWWRGAVFASAPAVPGPSPYGPLGPADDNGMKLPAGFSSRLVAVTGEVVGSTGHVWHSAPDGGACIADPDPANPGGWIYVSNAEISNGRGGVGALRFAADGSIVEAYTILSGTSRNCAGGMTPAGTWLSCEENGSGGHVYECSVTGAGQGELRLALGSFSHEAAAVDPTTGDVYLTEDDPSGRLYRFVPTVAGDLSTGDLFAAVVDASGAVTWQATSPSAPDRHPATAEFDGGEGLYIGDGVLYIATKGDRRIWELDLATSMLTVAYDCLANPSGALNAVDNLVVHHETGGVYVGEDGGNMEVGLISGAGDERTVAAFLRLTGHDGSEVTGMAFSPDGSRMYFSSQRGTDGSTGLTYEVSGPFVPTVQSEPVVLPIVEGSFVRDGSYANRRFRSPSTLQLSLVGSANGTRRPLLSVPIDAAPGPYTSATLRLTGRMRSGTDCHADVVPIESSWTAWNVKWNTQPDVTGPPVGVLDIVGTKSTVYEIDVTDHLNALSTAGHAVAAFGLRQTAATSRTAQIDGPSASTGQPELVLVQAATEPDVDPPVESVSVVAERDSFVRGGSLADTNYGWRRQLQVSLDADDKMTRRSVIAGSMPTLPRAVQSATLRIAGRIGTTTPSMMSVASTAPEWTNTEVTWNNHPAVGAVVAGFAMVGSATTWYDIDVTDHIEALRVSGAAEWSVGITQDQPGPVAYLDAGNANSGDHPHLVIDY